MGNNFNEYAKDRQSGAQPNTGPLSELDQNGYQYGSFIYPMDLGSPTAGKDHFIVFHINETTNTSYPAKGKVADNQMPTITRNDMNNQQKGLGGGLYAPPKGGETTGKQGGQAKNTVFDGVKKPITRIPTTIVLYMPNDIQTAYRADWEAVELGAAADLVSAAKGKADLQQVLESLGASGLKAAGEGLNVYTGLSLADAFSRAGRLSINPHQEVIFNGIGFRTFNFSFRFTPNSEEEAINIDNIIRAFKFYSTPEIVRGTAGRFWKYPGEFDIQYYANGKENLFLNKISTCALTDMQINYTASGQWSAHRPHSLINGAPPVCTDISLVFKELEIMTRERSMEGF